MKQRPIVTIGMCVKNGESCIGEAIKSVINQDFPHEFMEVIFVDDGSEDQTLSIIESYVPKVGMQVKVFHHEWKGLGPSRNVVVNNANGRYIIWVDCDNSLSKDHVRKQVGFMEQHPTVGIACGRFSPKHQNNVISTLECIEWTVNYYQCENKEILDPLGHFCGGGGGSIYRVKAIRHVGGFDENIKGAGEDFDAECKVTKAGWSLYFATDAEFYHRCKRTLKAIWRENFWYGYGGHYLLHRKMKGFTSTSGLKAFRFLPAGYKLTHRKVVFLFPLQQAFKKIAWLFGYTRAHIDGYGHEQMYRS